ncbi:N-acetylglucosaminyl transferase component, putative [Leishmania tarentolae]|uniref:N-acetylglucosaminyl transferase component, putative n=1 Tax=Leishmania tarentolae TaxID=5689 RepID=A0A640KLA3_LEITA|nr:N-acetylglucosaminyl transferase component, putative [Leishmania tarentolae]
MPLSRTTEICMLVWPLSAAMQILGPNDSIAWVVGWNDRSLYIIVTWFLRNCTLLEAKKELQQIRCVLQNYNGHMSEIPYSSLNILGCVRPHSAPSNCNFSSLSEEDIRGARKGSYLWLELLEGPVLGELWCCGARVQPCQLHVVRCDPSKKLSICPTIFSATALYGVSGVRQLQNGIPPVCAPGAKSNLEGVLLPKVMRKEAEPRVLGLQQQCRYRTSVINDSITLTADDSFFSDRDTVERSSALADKRWETALSASPSLTLHASSSAPDASVTAEWHRDGSLRDRLTLVHEESTSLSEGDGSAIAAPIGVAMLSDSEVDQLDISDSKGRWQSTLQFEKRLAPGTPAQSQSNAPVPLAGVPPRLDFTSTTDKAEMSVFLTTMRAGLHVRSVIQKEELYSYVEEDTVEPLTGLLKYAVDFISTYVVGLLKLLRFSRTAEILLYRTSEFAHFLCAVSFASDSCGLHPVLPHKVSPSINHRYVCIFGYVSRCTVDVVLGMLVYLFVSACGPSLYAVSHYMTRHWLYEVHASYMDWFDGYPAGLKVNEDLNVALCFFAKCVLELWDALLSWSPATLPRLISFQAASAAVEGNVCSTVATASTAGMPSTGFCQASEDQHQVVYEWVSMAFQLRIFCLLGCSTAAALVSDLTRLVSLHLRFLYHAVALPYCVARVLLTNLFRQFYGVKYNPLRKRYDSYHFQVDQMLAATFLFVIIIFLFPTLTVYYLYFSFVLTTIWYMETCLESIAYLSLHVPIHPIVYWICARHRLSGGVALSNPVITSVRRFLGCSRRPGSDEEELASHTVEVTVEALPLPLSAMLTDFFVVVDIIMTRLWPAKVVSLVLHGRVEHLPKMTDLLGPHLLTNCVSPRCTLCMPSPDKDTAKHK